MTGLFLANYQLIIGDKESILSSYLAWKQETETTWQHVRCHSLLTTDGGKHYSSETDCLWTKSNGWVFWLIWLVTQMILSFVQTLQTHVKTERTYMYRQSVQKRGGTVGIGQRSNHFTTLTGTRFSVVLYMDMQVVFFSLWGIYNNYKTQRSSSVGQHCEHFNITIIIFVNITPLFL